MTKSAQHEASDRRLDEDLRRALDPAPGVAERLARQALENRAVESGRISWLRPALVAVALLALVAVSTRLVPPVPPDVPPVVNPSASPALAEAHPPGSDQQPPTARLSISNLDGPITVTTADGTHWIDLSSSTASPTSGDPVS
ncbi:MAG: hypothetical protein MPN21_25075 [Thermoanaerobaculia bacterium]|nr:hypothetical protein [Thermoanaerobaculia bacterium]